MGPTLISPKNLVNHLYKNWEVIEDLVRMSRESPTFTEDFVLSIIARNQSILSDRNSHSDVLRGLVSNGVLERMERTSSLQINTYVLDFVRGLSREHDLGLASVLQVKIEAMKVAIQKVSDGISPFNHDIIRVGTRDLSELLRQISTQLTNDQAAINHIVATAKSTSAAMPIQQRYAVVLDAFEKYVSPMIDMIDIGIDGTFSRYLDQAENVLRMAADAIEIQGGFYEHLLHVRFVGYQANELQRFGRLVTNECANAIFPLREQVRKHNSVSSAVSYLLGRVRKRHLTRGLTIKECDKKLPEWCCVSNFRPSVGLPIREYLAEVKAYSPERIAFPDDIPENSHTELFNVDMEVLKKDLKEALPVNDLIFWLKGWFASRNEKVPDYDVMRLQYELSRDADWISSLGDNGTAIDLNDIHVEYHPHRLEVL